MTPEFVTLCVAVVALTGLAVHLLSRLAAVEADLVKRTEERDAARTCRDAARKERNKAAGDLETLRTATRVDAAIQAQLARLVIELGGREHVEADPAREIRRDRVARLTDFGSRP